LEAYLLWGDSFLKQGKLAEASRIGKQLSILAPQSPAYELFLTREALAYYEKDLEEGRKHFEAYFRQFGQSSSAMGAARSLGAFLSQKNLTQEIDQWNDKIGSLTPLVPVKTEFLMAKIRLLLDVQWDAGLVILQEVLTSGASSSQKTEALVSAAEAGVRTTRLDQAKDFARRVPVGADSFLRGRAQIVLGLVSLKAGEGIKVLVDLGKDGKFPREIRAQAHYEAWNSMENKKSPAAADLYTLLLQEFPDSSWANLVKKVNN